MAGALGSMKPTGRDVGHRALRTGELVVSVAGAIVMYASPRDVMVWSSTWPATFTFGMYLGAIVSAHERSNRTMSLACVFNPTTMKVGWVNRKLLRRLE